MRPEALAAVAALAVAAAACSGARWAPPTPAAGASASPSAVGEIRQSLYRLTYDGGDGRVSLRVVLRERGDAFQLTAADIAGRTVWGIDHRDGRVLLIDHRERRFCEVDPSYSLVEVHPSELPLTALPRVLDGRLPVPPPEPGAEVWTDGGGATWSAEAGDGGPLGWTLYDGDEPVVWWQRTDDGGILSRRTGEQYRWRLAAREAVRAAWPDPVPDGFIRAVCDG